MDGHLLEVKNLSISFTQYERGMRRTNLRTIRDLSVTVDPGEMVAVTSGWEKAPEERIKGEIPSSLRSSRLKIWATGAFPPWQTSRAIFLKP